MKRTAYLLVIFANFLGGYAIGKYGDRQVMAEQGLPSPAAIQRQLNQLEPENLLKIDGKLGKLTQEKWDRVYIEQSAKAAFAEFDKKETKQ